MEFTNTKERTIYELARQLAKVKGFTWYRYDYAEQYCLKLEAKRILKFLVSKDLIQLVEHEYKERSIR